jgi:putative transposase
MSNYRRNHVAGGTYFFTVNLLERKKTLLVDHIDELRHAIDKARNNKPFHIDGWVILPDHMHCIWTLPEGDDDYSGRWRSIKKEFSKSLPKTEHLSKIKVKRNERGIWQHRFWEHTIRDDRDYQTHMDYLHFNPVKHGLVESAQEWEYSTFHHLVKKRRIPRKLGWRKY